MRPASFTPRRLPSAIRKMNPSAIGTRNALRDGTAAMMAATPAEVETATVRT